MIIDWKVNSLNYEKRVIKSKYLDYKCPICKEKKTLIRHAYYERNFIRWNGHRDEALLHILRMKCTCCKRTHAILPRDIIPYHIYTFSFYWKMLRLVKNYANGVNCCVALLNIYHNMVYKLLHQFQFACNSHKNQYNSMLIYLCISQQQPKKKLHQILYYTT